MVRILLDSLNVNTASSWHSARPATNRHSRARLPSRRACEKPQKRTLLTRYDKFVTSTRRLLRPVGIGVNQIAECRAQRA